MQALGGERRWSLHVGRRSRTRFSIPIVGIFFNIVIRFYISKLAPAINALFIYFITYIYFLSSQTCFPAAQLPISTTRDDRYPWQRHIWGIAGGGAIDPNDTFIGVQGRFLMDIFSLIIFLICYKCINTK